MTEREVFIAALHQQDPAERAAFLARACGEDRELRERVEALLREQEQLGSFLERPAEGIGETRTFTPTQGDEAAARRELVPGNFPESVAPDSPAAALERFQEALGGVRAAVAEAPGCCIGPYRLLEQIGEGGFGIVFMAEQTQPLRRKVALKVLKPGMDTRQVVARFEAERQALALMDHPNIAHVFDGGETATGRPYFVMELVRGVPMTKYCDQNQLGIRERLELFISVCQAVQHAHQKGIIHRDIKPSNVLVALHDGTPVAKVIDFGIAKAVGQQLTNKTLFTGFAQMIGTPLYMSPEQAALSNGDVDTRSDVYSLGVLLYELLTGTTPFGQERLRQAGYDELRRIIREEEPPRPSTRLSTLGQAALTVSTQRKSDPKRLCQLCRGELDWIVMRALEKERNRRYESASAFAADLQRYLNDEPVLACPPSAWYRFRKFARRKRAALTTATLLSLAALLGGGGLLWLEGQRVARDGDVVGHLEEAERWERQGNWPQALRAVERAEGRLAGGGPADLRRRAEQVRELVQVVADLQECRLQISAIREEEFDFAGADRSYAKAFKRQGWDVEGLAAEEIAQQIAASPIRVQLVAALDYWVSIIPRTEVARRQKLQTIARLADDDNWRRQLRDPAVRKDRAALERLARQGGTLDQPPSNLRLMAQALAAVEAHSAAEDLLRRAQQRYPDDFWLNYCLGFHLAWRKPLRVEEAVGFFRAIVALRPQSPGASFSLGTALYDQGKPAEAEAEFRKAIRLKPDYAWAHGNLGSALYAQGKLAEAEAACRRAIELRPDYAGAYNNLGAVLREQGKPAEAEDACRKAIQLKPGYAGAYCNLGIALHAQGKFAAAEAEFRKAIDRSADLAEAHGNLGAALLAQGKPAAAEAACRKAIQLKPGYAGAYCNLGIALRDQGKRGAGEAALRRAIKLDPGYASAYFNLGIALLEQGRPAEAEEACRKALKLKRRWPKAYITLGNALHAQRKPAEAEAAFRKAIELKPDQAEAYDNLGVVLITQGKREAAEAAFRKAIELKPGLAEAYHNLGNTLFEQKKLAGAEAAYREAIKWRPDFALAHCNLGRTLAQQGRFAEALAAAKRGDELGSKLPGWRYPSAQWVVQIQGLLDLDGKLPRFIKREAHPAGVAEKLAVANLCRQPFKRLYAAATRFYSDAFSDAPGLADELRLPHRYNAACAAALAGCGQGEDAAGLDDEERIRLRRQAVDWLRADLAAWTKLLEHSPRQARAAVAHTVQRWQTDTDLAGLRDQHALAKLPEDERATCRKLWADVAVLLARVRPDAKESPPDKPQRPPRVAPLPRKAK
jgi:serine/threonine protein kinase/Flp pilus assembly protein TadD